MLVLGNKSGGPHHMQGYHTEGLGINLRKLVGFDFKYSSIEAKLFSNLYSQKDNMTIYILHQSHSHMCV
jgi:hypothetical protein